MYQLRNIQASDNQQLAKIIRTVSTEFGLAAESGFAVGDTTIDQLHHVYSQPNSQYWVVENENGIIFGGGGIAPLFGEKHILEIQKMYFLKNIRRLGFAKQILKACITFAEQHHFKSLYLETTQELWQAVQLYEKMGFKYLDHPKGDTGHSHACEIWMEMLI